MESSDSLTINDVKTWKVTRAKTQLWGSVPHHLHCTLGASKYSWLGLKDHANSPKSDNREESLGGSRLVVLDSRWPWIPTLVARGMLRTFKVNLQ